MTKKKAAFVDRDGVINDLVFNPQTKVYEAPQDPARLTIIPGVLDGLKLLAKAGYELFVVSNQPDYAKGKATMETLQTIASDIDMKLLAGGVKVRQYFYCYHHPEGIVKDLTGPCECRKPSPYFLLKAAKEYDLSLSDSWMIGDLDTDIECGQSAGCKTTLLLNEQSKEKRGRSKPDWVALTLLDAARYITQAKEK